jgi:hypothetical protein
MTILVDSMSPEQMDKLETETEAAVPWTPSRGLIADAPLEKIEAPDLSDVGVGLGMFILAAAALFLRPADFIPSADAVPMFPIGLIIALVVLHKKILVGIRNSSLLKNPVLYFVVGLIVAAGEPLYIQQDTTRALNFGMICLGFAACYLVLSATLDSLWRARVFTGWLALFAVAACAIGILNFLGNISVAPHPFAQSLDVPFPITRDYATALRLGTVTILNNPLDAARLTMVMAFSGLCWARKHNAQWLLPGLTLIAFLAYIVLAAPALPQ